MIKTVEIKSLEELISKTIKVKEEIINLDKTDKQYGGMIWFRGHANETWELLPTIKRNNFSQYEHRLNTSFYIKSKSRMPNTPRRDDRVFWISRMQHYGLKTRLLDWSESLLVALYFACKNEKSHDRDGCLWVLNPRLLNKKQGYRNTVYHLDSKTVEPFLKEAFSSKPTIEGEYKFKNKVIACLSVEHDLRILMQQSAFTIHDSNLSLQEMNIDKALIKFIIPAKLKKHLLSHLDICGFKSSTIFPDMEHVSEELVNEVEKLDF